MKICKISLVVCIVYFMLFILGCKKPRNENENNNSSNKIDFSQIQNATFNLIQANVYVKNMTTNIGKYYNLFDSTTSASNLDVFNPTYLPIDSIVKNYYTWRFNSNGDFILNTTHVYPFQFTSSNNIIRIFGLENGSARIVTFLETYPDCFVVKIYDSYGNDGVDSYSFFCLLTFKKNGSTAPLPVTSSSGYSYANLWVNPGNVNNSLVGTKWVVTKYSSNLNVTYPNDTLLFKINNKYSINGGVNTNYNLNNLVGSNQKSLTLYGFTTLSGDWACSVPYTFVNDYALNNILFNNLAQPQQQVNLWMERIQ